jgi:hypothetical protein
VTESAIPEDVRAFLGARIRSVGELEVLLLLHRHPDRWWTADQVNRELRTSLQSALQCLDAMRHAALAEEKKDGERSFRFRAADEDIARIVRVLRDLFRDRMASIVDIIYVPRQDSIRDFADAFRLTKNGGSKDG